MAIKSFFDPAFFLGFSNFKASSWLKLNSSLAKVYSMGDADKLPEPKNGLQYLYNQWFDRVKSNPNLNKYNKAKIKVSFIVNHNGALTDVKLLEGIDDAANKELVETFKHLRLNWTPGLLNNKPVRIRMILNLDINK